MKIVKFMGLVVLGLLVSIFTVSFAATRSFTILSPAGGEQWVLGTNHQIDFQINSGDGIPSPTSTIGYYLEGYPNKCIAGLPCPIKLGTSLANKKLNWQVGKDNGGRNIPTGQYVVRIVYPHDETDSSASGGIFGSSTEYSSIHTEGTSNTFQIIPVPTLSYSTPQATYATPPPAKTYPTPSSSSSTSSLATQNNNTTSCADGAKLVSLDLPSRFNIEPGQTRTFKVDITNNGDTDWTNYNFYQFRNTASQNFLTPAYGTLSKPVLVNDTISLDFTIIAPQVEGTYPINLQMVHIAGGEYVKGNGIKCSAPTRHTLFGGILSSVVTVQSTLLPIVETPSSPIDKIFKDPLLLIIGGSILVSVLVIGTWLGLRKRTSVT